MFSTMPAEYATASTAAKRIQKLEKEMKFLKQAYQPVTEQRRFHQESMEERRQKFTQLQTSKQAPLLRMEQGTTGDELRSRGFQLLRVLGEGAFGKDHLCIVTDFCPGGSLFTLTKNHKVPTATAEFYLACVVLGLEFLHSRHIVHRDIKEENVLIDSHGYVRIADFGLSGVLRDGIARAMCGTPGYIAPEMLQGLPYSTPVDWWSLGVMAYVMLVGTLLRKEPTRRLGSRGVLDVKQHAFFEKVYWEAILGRRVKPPYIPPAPSADDGPVDNDQFLNSPQRSLTTSEQALFLEFQDLAVEVRERVLVSD